MAKVRTFLYKAFHVKDRIYVIEENSMAISNISRFLKTILMGIFVSSISLSIFASEYDPISTKKDKQIARIKQLRGDIFETISEAMQEKAALSENHENHNKAALLTAVYFMSIPHMLSADWDFVSFFDSETKNVLYLSPDDRIQRMNAVKKHRNDFAIAHNQCLKSNEKTYGRTYERGTLRGIKLPDTKISMAQAFEKDYTPSYWFHENLDMEFYKLIKYSDERIGRLFWIDNQNISYLYETIKNKESLGNFQVRPVPKSILTSGILRINFSFTLDLLFESAYKLVAQNPERFIFGTYDHFMQIVSKDEECFEIDSAYVPQSEGVQDTPADSNWIEFITNMINAIEKSKRSE